MRYRLRTLMIVLAIGPMVLAGAYFLVGEVLSLSVRKFDDISHKNVDGWDRPQGQNASENQATLPTP